jgi:hypothetical protein
VWDAVTGTAPMGSGVGATLHLHGAWSHLAQLLKYVRALAEQQARAAPLTDAGAATAQPSVRLSSCLFDTACPVHVRLPPHNLPWGRFGPRALNCVLMVAPTRPRSGIP